MAVVFAYRGSVSVVDATQCQRDARRPDFWRAARFPDEHEVAFRVSRDSTLHLNHASCTALSASLSDPSKRYATPRRCVRCVSNCWASQRESSARTSVIYKGARPGNM
jgi:hypothetical protein